MSEFIEQSQTSDFRKFLASRFLITIAINIQSVTLGWQIYKITGNPFDLGLIGLSQFVPMLVTSIFAGAVVDRSQKYKLIMLCQSIFCASSFAFALCSIYASDRLWVFYLILGMIGVNRAFMSPAGQAYLPSISSKDDFPKFVAQSSTAWQLALIVGPSLGGILYAYFNHAEYIYFLCSALFLMSFFSFSLIKTSSPSTEKSATANMLNELKEGVLFLFSEKKILGAISLDLFAVLLGGATALLPVYARDILSVGPEGYGYLRSAPGLGATLMAVYLGRNPIKRNIGLKMFVSVIFFGIFTLGFAYSKSMSMALVFLFLMGVSDIVSVVTRGTLVQLLTPSNMRGRLSSINTVFISASNELGEFESGLTAKWFGTVRAVAIGGLGTIAIAIIWMRAFPKLRKLDRLS